MQRAAQAVVAARRVEDLLARVGRQMVAALQAAGDCPMEGALRAAVIPPVKAVLPAAAAPRAAQAERDLRKIPVQITRASLARMVTRTTTTTTMAATTTTRRRIERDRRRLPCALSHRDTSERQLCRPPLETVAIVEKARSLVAIPTHHPGFRR
jgi:hypothetical protein